MSQQHEPRIVRFAERRPERWSNGGGTTVEIARGPLGAADDAWDWRISVADIDRAGDFSAFPGRERLLTVVEGELLLLTVDGREQGLERLRPFRFGGGAAAEAALPTGAIRNLNVITGSGFRAHVAIVELSGKRPQPVFGGQHAVALQGRVAVGGEALERYDAVVGSDETPPAVTGRGVLAVVSVDPAA